MVDNLVQSFMGSMNGQQQPVVFRSGDYAGDNIQHIINHLFSMDAGRRGPPPTAAVAIEQLPEIKIDEATIKAANGESLLPYQCA